MSMFALRPLVSSLVTLTFVALGVACSGGGDGGGGGGGAPPVAADKASFIQQVCQAFAPCCTKAGRTPAQDQCEAVYTAFLEPVSYDPANGSACLGELQKLSGSATFCEGEGDGPAACKRVFQSPGTKKPGETCENTEDCAPSSEGEVECASLTPSSGATIRKCQLQVVGKVGDAPCAGTVDGNVTSFGSPGDATDLPAKAYLCAFKDGAYCDAKTGACKAVGKAGDACAGFDSYACGKDAYCDASASKCTPKVAAGGDCAGSFDACVATAYCDNTSNKCVAKKADGAACEFFSECLSGNCSDKKCSKDSGPLDLFCK
jgi:hypothetical protein